MVAVERLYPGETIACVASGPSLTAEDVAYLQGRCRVIAVNDGVRLAPWADVLYSSDQYWWAFHKGYPSYTGPKFGIRTVAKNGQRFAGLDVDILRNTGPIGLELEPTGLRHGKNSGYAAINLAVHLGAARVLLLGYNYGRIDTRPHFFGHHPTGLADPADWVFETWRRLAVSLVDPLKAAGVEVLNCTPGSALRAFPVAHLRAVLPEGAKIGNGAAA